MVTVTLSSSSTMRTLGGIGRWASDREGHAEDRAAAGAIAHLKAAAVALGDAETDPEAEARALLALRREEGLEDVREVLLGDSRSGIGDLDLHRVGADEARGRVAMRLRRDRDDPALRHRLGGVQHEVEDDLLDLVGRRHDLGKARLEPAFDLHIALAQPLRDQSLRLV